MSSYHPAHGTTLITPEIWADLYQERDPTGHKGTFGSIGIIGGCSGMSGAALLAGRSALKAGAGRVYVFLAQAHPDIAIDYLQPELMVRTAYDSRDSLARMDALAIGCGMGQSTQAIELLQNLLSSPQSMPLVIDADALNALSHAEFQAYWNPDSVVLTPHPTEAARLLQTTTEAIQQNRPESARQLAQRFNAWVVLKGKCTLVATPSGDLYQNPTGDVSLATAGTGDVLSGLLASLLGQGHSMRSATLGGVWLHGAAGQLLRQSHGGPIGCTASEVIDAIRLLRNNPQQLQQYG